MTPESCNQVQTKKTASVGSRFPSGFGQTRGFSTRQKGTPILAMVFYFILTTVGETHSVRVKLSHFDNTRERKSHENILAFHCAVTITS